MRLTTFTDYTIRTLIHLGLRPREFSTIAEIAAAYGISANHVMKVAQQLSRMGHVEALRGQHGGLRLARSASAINLGAVVRRTEPGMHVVPCLAGPSECRIHSACDVSGLLAQATQAFLAVLDRYTLADLLAGRQQSLARSLGVSSRSYPVAVALPKATEIAWDSAVPSGSSLAP